MGRVTSTIIHILTGALVAGILSISLPFTYTQLHASSLFDEQSTNVSQQYLYSPALTTEEKSDDSQQTQPSNAPYTLTSQGVEDDVAALGYSLLSLRARSITIQASVGPIPKRCASDGQMVSSYAEGLAVRNIRYVSCDSGEQPLYDAYFNRSYNCTVTYNQKSVKKLAILAHELGHCLYHEYGQYGEFDAAYKALRSVEDISQDGLRELIADDFMICWHGQDTQWTGSANYYTKYNVSRPTADVCKAFNALVDHYLL